MRLFFKLDCGRSVAVRALYYQRTYLSLLEGSPDQELNDRLLEEAQTQMDPLWGERQVHVITPEINESDPEHPSLPPVRFTAWLRGSPSRVSEGSELVVVWFREECSGEPMEQIVGEAIRSLEWDELAEEFEPW